MSFFSFLFSFLFLTTHCCAHRPSHKTSNRSSGSASATCLAFTLDSSFSLARLALLSTSSTMSSLIASEATFATSPVGRESKRRSEMSERSSPGDCAAEVLSAADPGIGTTPTPSSALNREYGIVHKNVRMIFHLFFVCCILCGRSVRLFDGVLSRIFLDLALHCRWKINAASVCEPYCIDENIR